jgi:hypothetical protein
MRHVILETDTIVIKQAVLSTNYDLTVDGGLSMEIRRLFYNDFISGGWGHIRLLSVVRKPTCLWTVPGSIHDLVAADLAALFDYGSSFPLIKNIIFICKRYEPGVRVAI